MELVIPDNNSEEGCFKVNVRKLRLRLLVLGFGWKPAAS